MKNVRESLARMFLSFLFLHVLLGIKVWGFEVLSLAKPRCAGSDQVILEEVSLALEE